MAQTQIITIAELKTYLSLTGTSQDTLLTTLVQNVSSDIEKHVGRKIGEKTWTEYHSGRGGKYLLLKNGPIVSVTSVALVSWDSAGSRVLEETLTNNSDYFVHGLVADEWKLRGYLESNLGAHWIHSTPRNYEVVYKTGYLTTTATTGTANPVPNVFKEVALDLAAYDRNQRKRKGEQIINEGSPSATHFASERQRKLILSRLDAYIDLSEVQL